MLPLESSLTITLHLVEGRVERAEIGSDRLVQASRMLNGRRPAQVLGLLPTVYALCGTAQGLAGLEAVEFAAGLSPSPAQRMARRFLCLIEMLAEHAAGVLRDWPGLLGEAPDLAALKPLRPLIQASRKTLYPGGDWLAPGGGRLEPEQGAIGDILRRFEEIMARLFSGQADDCLEDYSVFHAWIAHGGNVAARLMRRVEEEGIAGFGRISSPLMPVCGPSDLAERLASDDDGAYRAHPDCQGLVLETGPLARQHAHPLVAAFLVKHGNGLATRLVARLVEMATALRELEDLRQDLCNDSGQPMGELADGAGLGLADAARGLLAHRVELREGILRDYRILAPTEWNFHPQGPLVRGLLGASAPDLGWRAALLATSLDPCVPYRIEVAGHA